MNFVQRITVAYIFFFFILSTFMAHEKRLG